MQQLRHGLTIESNLYESSADDVDHLDALDAHGILQDLELIYIYIFRTMRE